MKIAGFKKKLLFILSSYALHLVWAKSSSLSYDVTYNDEAESFTNIDDLMHEIAESYDRSFILRIKAHGFVNILAKYDGFLQWTQPTHVKHIVSAYCISDTDWYGLEDLRRWNEIRVTKILLRKFLSE